MTESKWFIEYIVDWYFDGGLKIDKGITYASDYAEAVENIQDEFGNDLNHILYLGYADKGKVYSMRAAANDEECKFAIVPKDILDTSVLYKLANEC